MPNLTISAIRKSFLIIGKHIKLSLIGVGTATQYQGHMMATVAQGVSGDADEYIDFSLSIAPLQGSIAGFIAAANGIPAVAKLAIDNYLQNSLASDMGLASGLTSAQVLNALAPMMNAASPPQTVDGYLVSPSGTGFYTYIQKTYSVQLPTASGASSGTISDSLISSAVQS